MLAAAAAVTIMLPLLAAAPAAAAVPARAPSDCDIKALKASSKVPWEQSQTRFKDIWRMFRDRGEGIRVAVVDTGLERNPAQSVHQTYKVHPQIIGMRIEDGKDFTDNNEGLDWDNDCVGHGTNVASIIAAQPCSGCSNDLGNPIKVPFAGVAPNVTIMPLRVLNKKDDRLSNEAMAKAIQYAVDQDVDIINVSLETEQPWPAIREAVEAAYKKNIVIVAAAGNKGDTPAYPAKYANEFPNVISVGAMDEHGGIAEESGRNSNATIGGPGVGVHAANGYFGHDSVRGTSFAAPFVTGVVALMMVEFKDQNLTPAQIRRRLELTAIRPGRDVPDPQIGYGMVDPMAALTAILPENAAPGDRVPTGQVIPDLPPPTAPDNRIRDWALLLFGIAAGLALATLSFATVYRRGKARGWRPGGIPRTSQ